MTRKLQILRGTTAQNNAYTGAVGELTMDTDRNEVRIHDGQTVGGIKISDRNMPILTSMFFDHVVNDMSWLRADTFSWQSGDVYVAAYNHLADEFVATTLYAWYDSDEKRHYYTISSEPAVGDDIYGYSGEVYGTITAVGDGYIEENGYQYTRLASSDTTYTFTQTDTIGDITITYYLAEDGHKICLPDQEENLMSLYESTGAEDYYLLDTTNKQFKLPRKQKRRLIRAFKDGNTWYNLYSDGWVEQGGLAGTGETTTITLPIAMRDSTYKPTAIPLGTNAQAYTLMIGARDTTTLKIICGGNVKDAQKLWSVDGYAAESEYADAGVEYECYYVGNFEQSAIEQAAGITAEALNGKVDLPAGKAQSDVDFVVESQMPSAVNGYTWYRKYKSGWVEQGGRCTMPATSAHSFSNVAITLPVPIQAPESAVLSYSGLNASENFANCENQAALSATTATIGRWNNGNATAATRSYMWVLYAQAQ